jgi:hypothetical protein
MSQLTFSRTQYIPHDILNLIFCFADVSYKAFVWSRINRGCRLFFDKPGSFQPSSTIAVPAHLLTPFSRHWRWTCITSLTLLPGRKQARVYFRMNRYIRLTSLCIDMPDERELVYVEAEDYAHTFESLVHLRIDVGSNANVELDELSDAVLPNYRNLCFPSIQHLELFDIRSIHCVSECMFTQLQVAVLSYPNSMRSVETTQCDVDARGIIRIAIQATECVIFEPMFKRTVRSACDESGHRQHLYGRRHALTDSTLRNWWNEASRLRTLHVFTPFFKDVHHVVQCMCHVWIHDVIAPRSFAELKRMKTV